MKDDIRLSLSVITGNCEADVVRFLDTFQPHFDEVVVVRAIGSQDADMTLEIAQERGCIVGEYLNADANHWPHVDDFAAARNASAALCSGDWIVWADMDDTAEGLENLRALLAKLPEGTDILRCPYVVGEQGVVANYRERAWRNNGKHTWKNALHENLVRIDGGLETQAQTDAVKIIHIPRGDKECTKERNLRILESIPEVDRTHAHTFYLMTEYVRRKDPKAVELAKEFLAHPEGGQAERFETFMTLAGMAEDYADKAAIYTQAFSEDPSRVEPLYELTALSMSCGQPERALEYARHMMACKWPENPCWNHRKLFYGFFREDLYLQALRMNGHALESDTRRFNMLAEAGRPTISLLHATRGRPLQAVKTRMEWLRLADQPERVEHIFAVDYPDETSGVFLRFPSVFLNGDGGPVAAWNAAAEASKGDILIQLSDDWKPFKGWDTAIIDAIGDTSNPSVLAVSDGGRNDDLLCMAILTRRRYKDQGCLFHPEFFSMYSDGDFSRKAFSDGVVIDARDRITFEHMHPAFGKAEMDETYARSNAAEQYAFGQGIMRRLKSGIRASTDVHGWCDYRSLYSSIAKALPDGAKVVEIGSWMGQSIIHLCQRLQDLGKTAKVNCVDTWRGEENQPAHTDIVAAHGGSIFSVFNDNIEAAKVSEMIRVVIGDSAESAAHFEDASLDFIFIDAAHDYDSVVKDLAAWYPKLKPNGIFAGHDYPWHEVEKAVNEHAAANGYEVKSIGRCWVMGARQIPKQKAVLAIMAHDKAKPTVDQYSPRWKTLGLETRLYVPEGDTMEGTIQAGESAHSGIKVYQRFIKTLEHLLETSDKEVFIVAEYDTVNMNASLPRYTPGRMTSYLIRSAPHNQTEGEEQLCALSPWIMDRATMAAFIKAGYDHIEKHGACDHLSGLLDRWIGEVVLTHNIPFAHGNDLLGYPFKEGVEDAIRSGKTWVHGFKSITEFQNIWNQYPYEQV